MSQLAEIIFSFVLLIVMVCAVLSFLFLISVVKIEHDDFYAQWKKDGSPHGLPIWVPSKESHDFGFGTNPWSLGNKWLFKTPDWVKKHKVAFRFFRFFRISSYVCYSGLLFIFIIFLVSFSK